MVSGSCMSELVEPGTCPVLFVVVLQQEIKGWRKTPLEVSILEGARYKSLGISVWVPSRQLN